MFEDKHGPVKLAYVSDKYVGDSGKIGFSHFDKELRPSRFTLFRYSLDCMIPLLNLHCYLNYYPESWAMRGVTVFQHTCGWWWTTVFLASITIF